MPDNQEQLIFGEVAFDPKFQVGSLTFQGGGLVYLRIIHPKHGLLDFLIPSTSAAQLTDGVTNAVRNLEIGHVASGEKPN